MKVQVFAIQRAHCVPDLCVLLSIVGRIKLSPCLSPGYKPKVLFLWEIQAVGIDLGVVNQPRLRIAPRALPGGKVRTFLKAFIVYKEEEN